MKDEATVVRPRAGGNFLFGRTAIRPGPQDLDKQKGSSPLMALAERFPSRDESQTTRRREGDSMLSAHLRLGGLWPRENLSGLALQKPGEDEIKKEKKTLISSSTGPGF